MKGCVGQLVTLVMGGNVGEPSLAEAKSRTREAVPKATSGFSSKRALVPSSKSVKVGRATAGDGNGEEAALKKFAEPCDASSNEMRAKADN